MLLLSRSQLQNGSIAWSGNRRICQVLPHLIQESADIYGFLSLKKARGDIRVYFGRIHMASILQISNFEDYSQFGRSPRVDILPKNESMVSV